MGVCANGNEMGRVVFTLGLDSYDNVHYYGRKDIFLNTVWAEGPHFLRSPYFM